MKNNRIIYKDCANCMAFIKNQKNEGEKVKKSQCLFLVIGDSILPNFISGCTRLQNGGTIVFLHSNKTLDNAKRLESKLKSKYNDDTKFTYIQISPIDDVKVEDELQKSTSDIFNAFDSIELDYTGATKAMSAGCFYFFRKKACNLKDKKIILSYLDNERDRMYYEIIENGEKILKDEPLRELDFQGSISIEEIFEINSKKLDFNYNIEPEYYELGKRIADKFVDCSEDEYRKRIHILEEILHDARNIDEKVKGKKGKEELIKIEFEKVDKKKYSGILNGEEINSRLLKALKGFWLEDYVLKLLFDIKDKNKGSIIEVINSAKNTGENKFEIDFIVLKKYSPILISVTTQADPEEAVYKLFEVMTRAKELDAYKSCFISLCPDSKKLEEKCANVWEKHILRNTLIIGVDRFKNIYSMLEQFITA